MVLSEGRGCQTSPRAGAPSAVPGGSATSVVPGESAMSVVPRQQSCAGRRPPPGCAFRVRPQPPPCCEAQSGGCRGVRLWGSARSSRVLRSGVGTLSCFIPETLHGSWKENSVGRAASSIKLFLLLKVYIHQYVYNTLENHTRLELVSGDLGYPSLLMKAEQSTRKLKPQTEKAIL